MKIPDSSKTRYWMPFDSLNRRNPYPMYERLRNHEPVHYDEWSGVWVATSYEAVKQVLSKKEFETFYPWNTFKMPLPNLFRAIPAWILLTEGETHKKLRSIAKEVITWDGLDVSIKEVIDTNISRLKNQKKIDIVHEYAILTPVNIITKVLGLPIEDALLFKKWSSQLIWATSPYVTPKMYRELEGSAKAFIEYLEKYIPIAPKDSLILKLLSVSDDDGQFMTNDEVISFVIFLFLSGEETVVNFIGNAIDALLKHPDKIKELQENPEKITYAVEELLRYDTSLQHSLRIVKESTNVAGQEILKGQIILPVMAAANRDPLVFEKPNNLDFNRKKMNHLSFGVGRHYCFGARLARMESKYAIQRFINELGDYTPEKNVRIRYNKNIMFRGLRSLPIVQL